LSKDDPYRNVRLTPWRGPPYSFRVWVQGEKLPRRMFGFDAEHIRNQIWPKKVKKIQKLKEDG
jgi:hypothetical protein